MNKKGPASSTRRGSHLSYTTVTTSFLSLSSDNPSPLFVPLHDEIKKYNKERSEAPSLRRLTRSPSVPKSLWFGLISPVEPAIGERKDANRVRHEDTNVISES